MGRTDNKIAVVTGAARGIGRASATLLAQEGAKVAVTDVIDEGGRELIQALQGEGLVAEYWSLDVTDEEAIRRTFSEVSDWFGKVDVLVNNAGITGTSKSTGEYSVEE